MLEEQAVDQNQYLEDIGNEEPTVETENIEAPQAGIPESQAGQEEQSLGKEETKPEKPDFMQSYFNEDGSVNVDNYLSTLKQPTPQNIESVVKNVQPQPIQAPGSEPEKSEIDVRKEYRENLHKESFLPFNRMRELVNSGYTVEQAFQQAEGEVNQSVMQKNEDWLLERQTLADTDRAKAEKERIESLQLAPRSETNINRLSNEFGYKSVESFRNALFHDKYGGQDINYLFSLANPDYKTEYANNQQGLVDAYNNWFVKFSADENNLRYLANQVKFRSASELWAPALKQMRGGVQAQEQQKRTAGMKTANSKNLNPVSAQPNELNDWLSGTDKRIDNI